MAPKAAAWLLSLFLLLKSAWSLELSCGTRGANYPTTRVLSCTCVDNYREEGSFTSLSMLLNAKLIEGSSVRPPSQRVTSFVLASCGFDVRLELDLDRVNPDYANLTDVNFERIKRLEARFGRLQNRETQFVFSDIEYCQLEGSIPGRDMALRFFFRNTRPRSMDMEVVFNRVSIGGLVRLLNFQNIVALRVVGTRFDTIQDLETQNVGRCYASLQSSQPVSCTREELFYQYQSSSYGPYTRYPTPWSAWSTGLESTATALPYSSTVTSSPLFIVGMVLLAGIIIIVVLVSLYVRHQKRREGTSGLLN